MKKLFKFIIGNILAFKAKQYLKNHRTQVIAVTGSIGKTSTKEAIYHILKSKFNVYRSKKSFNTPIGLSLAILQEEESGFSSVFAWMKILKRVFKNKKKVYEKIILEMGADGKGDIKKLVKIAHPDISVITNISPVHMGDDQFNSIEEIAEEKSIIIKSLNKDGLAILNDDDVYISNMTASSQVINYGTGPNVTVQAKNIISTSKNIKFVVLYNGEEENFTVPILGSFQIYVLLPAISIGLKMGMTLKECSDALSDYKLPLSRMNPIEGVNKSMIIDSSYNASPVTMSKALNLLKEIPSDRKIAALGTMNELGNLSKQSHLDLGKSVANIANILVAVGSEASTIKQGAVQSGMLEKNIFTFLDSESAGYFLKDMLSAKDIVLVKGSQNRVRMEKLVKIVMSNPSEANKLLCRQGEAWDRIYT